MRFLDKFFKHLLIFLFNRMGRKIRIERKIFEFLSLFFSSFFFKYS